MRARAELSTSLAQTKKMCILHISSQTRRLNSENYSTCLTNCIRLASVTNLLTLYALKAKYSRYVVEFYSSSALALRAFRYQKTELITTYSRDPHVTNYDIHQLWTHSSHYSLPIKELPHPAHLSCRHQLDKRYKQCRRICSSKR